jgi:hypothetical protein
MTRIRVTDRTRWEEHLLDLLASALSWRLAVFGRIGRGDYRRLARRELMNGRFASGGKRFIRDDGVVFTGLRIRKSELMDLCAVSPLLDRRRVML